MTYGEYRKCLGKQTHVDSGTSAELRGCFVYQRADPEHSSGSGEGGERAMRPGPVKISYKKDGRRGGAT